MGERKGLWKFLWVPILLASFFIFPAGISQAASEINFSQSILPVKFVYLDARGGIEKVWSNVSPTDSLYAVKFFDARKETELPDKPDFMGKYFSYAERQNKCEFLANGKINHLFEYKQSGETFEEIQTVV